MKAKVVFWDVYGTLIAAESGDLDSLVRRQEEWSAVFDETAHKYSVPAKSEQFLAAIRTRRDPHQAHSEIRIEEVWRELMPGATLDRAKEAALFFERRANPKYAQSEAVETLTELHRLGFRQGVVSNGQFYTRIELSELLPAVFDPSLMFFSCDLGIAKPDLTAFRLAREQTGSAECLYVGDSPVNDIGPARQVGFTALLFGPGGDIQRLSQVLEHV